MKYRIQTFYPAAGCFMNTNHESDDLEKLKRLARGDTFASFRIRIVDEQDALKFAPPVRARSGEPTVADIAAMLDVPVLPPIILPPEESDDDDDT
jgi:hypothetical protein